MQQISYFSHALCSAAVAFVAIHPHEARCIGRMCENSSTCPAGTAGSSLKDQLQPARRVGNSSIGAAKRLKCSTWSLSTQFYPTKCKTLWLSYIFFFIRWCRRCCSHLSRSTVARQPKTHAFAPFARHRQKFNEYARGETVRLILFHANIKHCLFRSLAFFLLSCRSKKAPETRQQQHINLENSVKIRNKLLGVSSVVARFATILIHEI